MRLFPDLRLVGVDPVGFRLSLQICHRFGHAAQAECQPPQTAHRLQPIGAALVQPYDGRAQVDQRGALGGQGHPGDSLFVDNSLRPKSLAGLAKAFPEILRVLLSPAGLGREIRLKRYARFRQQVALQVENQRPHRLGSVINGEDQVFSHRYI
jgi:hypothetical protein